MLFPSYSKLLKLIGFSRYTLLQPSINTITAVYICSTTKLLFSSFLKKSPQPYILEALTHSR